MGTLDVAQRISGNSYARTTPRTRLRLSANPQRAMASGTSYAAERQQHYDDGDRERGVERQPWNPCHSLEDYRRDQASKEQRHNYTPDDSVSLTKVFAHSFHGARFYSLWSAAQCSRQPEREARLDPKLTYASGGFLETKSLNGSRSVRRRKLALWSRDFQSVFDVSDLRNTDTSDAATEESYLHSDFVLPLHHVNIVAVT